MENIKLETDLKLETLFLSLNADNATILNDILAHEEIDVAEKQLIRKFLYLVEHTGTPDIVTLKKEFPSMFFDGVEKISDSEVHDYVSLYIQNRKQRAASNTLINLASKVRSTGVTEEIANVLNQLTKSDVTSNPYVNRGKNIVEFYEKKNELTGISTGVKRIDELTRRIATWNSQYYTWFHWFF